MLSITFPLLRIHILSIGLYINRVDTRVFVLSPCNEVSLFINPVSYGE